MQYIPFCEFLSEKRETETRFLEVVRCHFDEESRRDADEARKRLRLYDHLIKHCKPHHLFPNDVDTEKVFDRFVEGIISYDPQKDNHLYDHLFLTRN